MFLIHIPGDIHQFLTDAIFFKQSNRLQNFNVRKYAINWSIPVKLSMSLTALTVSAFLSFYTKGCHLKVVQSSRIYKIDFVQLKPNSTILLLTLLWNNC